MIIGKIDVFSVHELIGKTTVQIEKAAIVNLRNQKLFIFADSDGWISAVNKKLTLQA